MTTSNSSTEPSLRVRAWRAICVSVTNEALRRGLFKTVCPQADSPEPEIRLHTDVKITGRGYTLWIEDAGFSPVRLEVIEQDASADRGRRAAWYIDRREGLSILAPRRAFEPLSGFTRNDQAELAALPVEPVGYGFAPTVQGAR